MSLASVLTITKNSFVEYSNSVEWLDLTSRASVVAGSRAAFFNETGVNNAIVGFGAASDQVARSGSDLALFGTFAGNKNRGDYNTWIGAKSGFENETGDENTGVGYFSGGSQKTARGNSVVGFRAGASLLGSGNVAVGHSALDVATAGESNVVLGALSQARGDRNVVAGAYSFADGDAVAIGYDSEAGEGSVVIGSRTIAGGKRSLLIMPSPSGARYASAADGALDIYGVLRGSTDAAGRFAASLGSDSLALEGTGARVALADGAVSLSASSNIAFLSAAMFGGNASFDKPAFFSDRALFAGESVFDGGAVFRGPVSLGDGPVTFGSIVNHGELTNHGKASFKSGIHVCCGPAEIDELVSRRVQVEHLSVSGDTEFARLSVASLSADSVNARDVSADSVNARAVGADSVNARAVSAESASFSNLTVDGVPIKDLLTGPTSLHDAVLTGVTRATSLAVSGDASFGRDVTVGGTLSAERLEITGGLSFDSGLPIVFGDAIVAESTLTVRGESALGAVTATTVEASTLTATGHVTTKGCVVWDNPLGVGYWRACLENVTPDSADLIFRSSLGASMTLCDDFEPGVLNFTGKHRCSPERGSDPGRYLAGLIVVTTGALRNLDGTESPSIDESLPVVRISDAARDTRAYGVVSGYESEGGAREFRLANMSFGGSARDAREAKVVVNSAGEGGMWVCDETGCPGNGDLLETSSVPGHARKQADDIVRSSTVAKVSADVRGWQAHGPGRMRAFAAVVYKF